MFTTYVFVCICVLYTHLFVFTPGSLINFGELLLGGINNSLFFHDTLLQFPNYSQVIYKRFVYRSEMGQ